MLLIILILFPKQGIGTIMDIRVVFFKNGNPFNNLLTFHIKLQQKESSLWSTDHMSRLLLCYRLLQFSLTLRNLHKKPTEYPDLCDTTILKLIDKTKCCSPVYLKTVL